MIPGNSKMLFDVGNWFSSKEIRTLSLSTRMIWFELLCLMWQSSERGKLKIYGKPLVLNNSSFEIISGSESICEKLGISFQELQSAIKELGKYGVYSLDKNGILYFNYLFSQVESGLNKSGILEAEFISLLFASCFGKEPSEVDMQITEEYIQEYGKDEVREAFKIARSNDKCKLNYVRGILENKKNSQSISNKKNGNAGGKSKHSAESLHQRWADWLERNPQHKNPDNPFPVS